jgi:2-methylisocitrate lyase-like PEP mutase family enzyme
MSKLRDRIADTARRRTAKLGFATSADAATRQRGVVVIAEVADPDAARTAIDDGATALLLTGDGDASGLRAVVEVAGDAPVGVRHEHATADDVSAFVDAGADFLLFDAAETAADALLDTSLGHLLLLPDGASDDDLRLLAPLDLDAIAVPAPAEAMTVRAQLQMRRVTELTRARLLVPATGAVDTPTLEVWRAGGVAIVLVPSSEAASLASTVAAAAELKPPRERSEERPMALVPSAGSQAEDEEEDEEEFDLR